MFIQYAIIERNYDLYVDRIDQPQTYIMHVPPAYICYGVVNPNETHSILSIIDKGAWILSPNNEWDEYLCSIFNQRIKSYQRTAFDESALQIEQLQKLRKPLPEGLKIVEISDKHVGQWMIKSQIIDRIFVHRPFLTHGFGLCLIDTDEVVQGFALTNYPIGEGNQIEVSFRIGFDDHQEYRRKGIGTTLVSQFIEMSLQKGYFPIWDAATDVSANIAKKLGYIEKRKWYMHHITD